MITILARNTAVADAFANGTEYKFVTQVTDMFGAEEIHVMFDWESNKITCTLRKLKAMLKLQELNPRCNVVRHDIINKKDDKQKS